jgi:hypothetical protein
LSTHLIGQLEETGSEVLKVWRGRPVGGPTIGGVLQKAPDARPGPVSPSADWAHRAPTAPMPVSEGGAWALLGHPVVPWIGDGASVSCCRREHSPRRGISDELRIHQETIVPLWEGGRLAVVWWWVSNPGAV